MALNSSGQISLGGGTTGQSVNLELQKTSNATVSLNDTDVRNLAGVVSGAISFSNLHGKSNGYYYTMATKTPVFGTGGGAYPPSGWIGVVANSVDDNSTGISIPFSFYMYGNAYTSVYVGSNGYITFGSGSSNYSSLSYSNPSIRKIMYGAGDNSYQRVSYLSTSNYLRIRVEGNGSSSGTVGSPGIVVEFTIFNPAKVQGGKAMVEMLVGNHNRTSGVSLIGIGSSSAYVNYTIAVNQSFVFLGDTVGNAYQVFTGAKATGVDY